MIITGKFYYTQHYSAVKVRGNNTIFFPHLSNCAVENNPPYEANSRCGSCEISDVLQKPNVRHRIHNRPLLVPVLSLLNAAIPVEKQFSDASDLPIVRFLHCFGVNISFELIMSPFCKTSSAGSSTLI